MKDWIPYIASKIGEKVVTMELIIGGSISSTYMVETIERCYFLKANRIPFAQEMFYEERKGLQAIEQTETISVPHVYLIDTFNGHAFILMDYVEKKQPSTSDSRRLGTQLAMLHQSIQSTFGFSSNNFIGNLPQSNNEYTIWAEFYWFERILPQLKLAFNNGYISRTFIPKEEVAIDLFYRVSGNVKPTLLHGDLWNGNYLIATDGTPYLIDPAVYYGHSMVDIAMSRLFGGFDSQFYDAYHDIIPQSEYYDAQVNLYQLYYLLVHLNLFGTGYYSSVTSIIKKYF